MKEITEIAETSSSDEREPLPDSTVDRHPNILEPPYDRSNVAKATDRSFASTIAIFAVCGGVLVLGVAAQSMLSSTSPSKPVEVTTVLPAKFDDPIVSQIPQPIPIAKPKLTPSPKPLPKLLPVTFVPIHIENSIVVAIGSGETGNVRYLVESDYPQTKANSVDRDRLNIANTIQDELAKVKSVELATQLPLVRSQILTRLPKTVKAFSLQPSLELLAGYKNRKAQSRLTGTKDRSKSIVVKD